MARPCRASDRWCRRKARNASVIPARSICHSKMVRKRTAILISGRGSNMTALIEAAKKPSYPAEIALVVSNRPHAKGLQRAAAEGIATEIVDHTRFPRDREGFERALQSTLELHRIEMVCLAGFMRVLTAW